MWLIWYIPFLFAIDAVLEKWSYLLVMPVTEKQLLYDCLIYTSCLCIFKVSLLFVLMCQRWVCEVILGICTVVSLHSMFVDKDRKTKYILGPFCGQTAMTIMNLFEDMLQTVCLYLIMCYNWSDKLLQPVLRLMDIHVTYFFHQCL